MKRGYWIAFLLAAFGAPADAKDGGAVKAEITGIEARFVYGTTGALSENIAPPSKFAAWNTMIGEGDAKEPASDLLVIVTLKSEPAEANLPSPLTITLSNDRGRVLARRTITSLFVKDGKAARAMFVPDAACLGKVAIKATMGASQRVTNLQLNCGE